MNEKFGKKKIGRIVEIKYFKLNSMQGMIILKETKSSETTSF